MIDVDAVADAANHAPGVSRLGDGTWGEAATYLPGRRVTGVRIVGDSVEVHVIAAHDAVPLEVARNVRAALADRASIIDVVVDDIEDKAEDDPADPAAG